MEKTGHKMRRFLLAGAFALAAGYTLSADAGPQTVHTVFLAGGTYPDGHYDSDTKTVKLTNLRSVYTEVVQGDFAAKEAVRYDIVAGRMESRTDNRLISFTSAENLIPPGSDKNPSLALTFKIPQGAYSVSLADLPPAQLDQLLSKYRKTVEQAAQDSSAITFYSSRQSIPAGLLDPALYSGLGYDGYSFQPWKDAKNYMGGGPFFRDIGALYESETSFIGKKILVEAVVSAEARYCRFMTDAAADSMPKTNDKDCRQIEKLSRDELGNVQSRARLLGLNLSEEDLHTTIRDSGGGVLAADVTKTLSMVFDTSKGRYTGAPVHTFQEVVLAADKSRVDRICTASFDTADPEAQRLREKLDANCDDDIITHQVGEIKRRFTLHGRKHHLPAAQKRAW